MQKVWICLVLLSIGTVAFVPNSDHTFDNLEYYRHHDKTWCKNNLWCMIYVKQHPDKLDETDDIKEDKNTEEDKIHVYPDYDKSEDALNADYQIEDNRSAPKDDDIELRNLLQRYFVAADSKSEEETQDYVALKDVAESEKEEIVKKKPEELPNLEEHGDEKIFNFVKEDDTDVQDNPQSEEISFDINSDIKPLPLPPMISDEEIQKVIEEILSRKEKNNAIQNPNDDKYIEETKQILEELDNESKENKSIDGFEQEAENDAMQLENFKDTPDLNDAIAEDTVDKIYDLNNDLDKLMDTWKKLSVSEISGEKNADDSINPNNVQQYEDKYNRPFREENVLSLRDDYYEDVANHDEELNKKGANAFEQNDEYADDLHRQVNDDKAAEFNKEDLTEEDSDDMIFSTIGKEDKEANQNSSQEDTYEEDDEEYDNYSLGENVEDNIFYDKFADIKADESSLQYVIPKKQVGAVKSENNPADVSNTDELAANIDTGKEQSVDDNDKISNDEPILYLKDAISPNENDQSYQKDETTSQLAKHMIKSIDVSELNPTQYNELMEQFKKLHEDELDVHSESFGKNIAVDHVTLSLYETVVVQSPDYPQPYPTNNIVDWIFEGEGVGIELNITDFSVNGFFGDYLLVKPGGVDETGHDGLVFSYRLNEPRRYRFLDVSRMFVRFEASDGNPFFTGFQFSVKMIAPLPELEEILPEPEAVMPEPRETLTLVLGGMDTLHFSRIQEQFRLLVADMATLYINTNDIDPGSNTTYETTQITNIAVCNINWPDFENCAQVTFAVPVVYDDDEDNYDPQLSAAELNTMWETYSSQDPFAARLRGMGLTEFASPNDSNVLMVWLVISVGVLVCMSMLAFALWRYSCVDTYTKMPEFSSENGGYKEKQGLDLYPTPHQTLPPLYESDYKWADVKYQDSTRDMDGFVNRSFTRDELFDIESDEDVISTRDRKLEFAVSSDASKV